MKIKIHYTNIKKIRKYIFKFDNKKIIPMLIKNT